MPTCLHCSGDTSAQASFLLLFLRLSPVRSLVPPDDLICSRVPARHVVCPVTLIAQRTYLQLLLGRRRRYGGSSPPLPSPHSLIPGSRQLHPLNQTRRNRIDPIESMKSNPSSIITPHRPCRPPDCDSGSGPARRGATAELLCCCPPCPPAAAGRRRSRR